MIVTHADSDFAALCGETQPDSSGIVATSVTESDVDCLHCLEAMGRGSWWDDPVLDQWWPPCE